MKYFIWELNDKTNIPCLVKEGEAVDETLLEILAPFILSAEQFAFRIEKLLKEKK